MICFDICYLLTMPDIVLRILITPQKDTKARMELALQPKFNTVTSVNQDRIICRIFAQKISNNQQIIPTLSEIICWIF